MNTTKSNPKTELLLGAGLNVLHFESREWLDTIDFWKDEIRFFNDLLKKRESSEKNKPYYQKALKNLDVIYGDLFKDLEESILEHERLLSKIELSEKGVSDSDYREKHRSLHSRMNTFTNDFKSFKKNVFDYEKDL